MNSANGKRTRSQPGLSGRRWHIVLAALAASSMWLASPALSAPEMTPFEEAVAHFKAGEYARAAPAFHIAYSRDPKPVLLFNAALSEQRSNQFDLARRDYKRVLSRKDLHPKIAARARKGLAEVEAALAGPVPPPTVAAIVQPKPAAAAPTAPKATPKTPPPAVAATAPQAAPQSAPVAAARPDVVGVGKSAGWQTPAGWAGVGLGAVLTGLGGWLLATWSADEAAYLDGLERKDNKIVNVSNESFQAEWDKLDGQHNVALATTISGVVLAGAGAWLLLTAPAPGTLTLSPTGRGMTVGVLF